MEVKNLDVGVRRALRAYKLEKGLSEAAADAFASSKLAEGMAYVRAFLDKYKIIDEGTIGAAFADLKVWAQK